MSLDSQHNPDIQQEQAQQQTQEPAKSPEDIVDLFKANDYETDKDFIDQFNTALNNDKAESLMNEEYFKSIDVHNTGLSSAEAEFKTSVESLKNNSKKVEFIYKVIIGLQKKLIELDKIKEKANEDIDSLSSEELVTLYNSRMQNTEQSGNSMQEVGDGFLVAGGTLPETETQKVHDAFAQKILNELKTKFEGQYEENTDGTLRLKGYESMDNTQLFAELKNIQENIGDLMYEHGENAVLEKQLKIIRALAKDPDLTVGSICTIDNKTYEMGESPVTGFSLEPADEESLEKQIEDLENSAEERENEITDKLNKEIERREKQKEGKVQVSHKYREFLRGKTQEIPSEDLQTFIDTMEKWDASENGDFRPTEKQLESIDIIMKILPIATDRIEVKKILEQFKKISFPRNLSSIHPTLRNEFIMTDLLEITAKDMLSIDFNGFSVETLLTIFNDKLVTIVDGEKDPNFELYVLFSREFIYQNKEKFSNFYEKLGKNQQKNLAKAIKTYGVENEFGEVISDFPNDIKADKDNWIVQGKTVEGAKKMLTESFTDSIAYISHDILKKCLQQYPNLLEKNIFPVMVEEENSDTFQYLASLDLNILLRMYKYIQDKNIDIEKKFGMGTREMMYMEFLYSQENFIDADLQDIYRQVLSEIRNYNIIKKSIDSVAQEVFEKGKNNKDKAKKIVEQILQGIIIPPSIGKDFKKVKGEMILLIEKGNATPKNIADILVKRQGIDKNFAEKIIGNLKKLSDEKTAESIEKFEEISQKEGGKGFDEHRKEFEIFFTKKTGKTKNTRKMKKIESRTSSGRVYFKFTKCIRRI
ncbi:hypothetical protein KGV52_00460 [Candidatus Gracilibacteria bacterium]|nr:hypothetical protein [Candidatus Gracilibacteria bacterium]